MRVAILESIVMPAGHEVEFDRILVEEFKNQGHKPIFFVPQNYPFKFDYKTEIVYLEGGEAISYAGVGKIKKIWLSLQREQRRIAWFNDACKKAKQGLCDAIIIPTSSWRGLRSILKSDLKESPVPVLIILHGIMPKDKSHLIDGVKACESFKNVHIADLGLQTLSDFDELTGYHNFHTLLGPVYKPFDLQVAPEFNIHEPIKLGFFGQYRKEKNLSFFLEAFCKAKFNREVELLVQGATVTKEDSDDFERLTKLYSANSSIRFLHKNLLGIEWQQELMNIDVLLLPYAAERYRYQPSAMLFTAIGYYKPVLQSPEMNPEILSEFNIGEAVELATIEQFSKQLERFINTFEEKKAIYQNGLIGANQKYSHEQLIKSITKILD
ncbi:MAG: glycosyltransferase family 1 protein [Bacteroidia bacterium]|nr:glycosyltransferase family 1 protein [Bacteroidia bacterium]